jgi:hypothetical protein
VVGSLEEQEQRVARELEEAAALAVGERQERLERGPDRLDQLLGPLPPAAGQALGQARETGDVGEEDRRVEGVQARGGEATSWSSRTLGT